MSVALQGQGFSGVVPLSGSLSLPFGLVPLSGSAIWIYVSLNYRRGVIGTFIANWNTPPLERGSSGPWGRDRFVGLLYGHATTLWMLGINGWWIASLPSLKPRGLSWVALVLFMLGLLTMCLHLPLVD